MIRFTTTLSTLLITVTVLGKVGVSFGDYIPNQAFLAQMDGILADAPIVVSPLGAHKEIRVGKKLFPGEVAYFLATFAINEDQQLITVIDSAMHLEEYALLGDGNYRVTIWRVTRVEMSTWSLTLTPTGTLVGRTSKEIFYKPGDPLAIQISERIQQILLRAGKQA